MFGCLNKSKKLCGHEDIKGGSAAERLECWTCNSEAPSTSPRWPLVGFVLGSPEFQSTARLVKYPTGLPPTSWDSLKTCYVPFRLFFHYPLKVPEIEGIIKLLILLLLYFIWDKLPAVLINWSLHQTPAQEELWRRYQINFIWQRHPRHNSSFPKTVPFAYEVRRLSTWAHCNFPYKVIMLTAHSKKNCSLRELCHEIQTN